MSMNCTEKCGLDGSNSLTDLVNNCCNSEKITQCCSGECTDELKKPLIFRSSANKKISKPVDFNSICKNSTNPLDLCACQFCNKDGVSNYEECISKKATEISDCLDKKYGGSGKADLCKNLVEQINMPTACRACYACSYKKLCATEKFHLEYDSSSGYQPSHYIETNRTVPFLIMAFAVFMFVGLKYCCK